MSATVRVVSRKSGRRFFRCESRLFPESQRRDDVAMLAFDACIEHGDDTRMLQAGELAGFLDERRTAFRGVRPPDVRDLDRNRPFELAVKTLVHGREAPASNGAANDIAAEPAWPRAPR